MQKEKKLKSAFHTGVTKVTLQGQQTAFLWNERQCKLNVATRKSAGIKRKENKNHFLKMQQTEAVSDFLHVTLLMLACFHIIGSQCPETMCLCLEDVLMCWCAVETLTAVDVLLTFMLSVDLSFDMKKTRRVSWGEGAQSTTLNFHTWINHQNQVWCIYLFDHWGNVVKTTYTAVLFTLYTLHSFLYPEHPSVNVCVVVGNLQLLSCSFRDNQKTGK